MLVSKIHVNRTRQLLTSSETDFDVEIQKAICVGVRLNDESVDSVDSSMKELFLLVDTAGAEVVHSDIQPRKNINPKYYIGSGKAEELKNISKELDVDLIVFNDELSPAQQFNLEKLFKCDVVDRTGLILDIFGQHAKSSEGMTQVELAQMRCLYPRLRGKTENLSQQTGGIGTRGPGETQLQQDRRHILKRISFLESKAKKLKQNRTIKKKQRLDNQIPSVALVGYTNAGKSSLLNVLTKANVGVENRLFATLDSTTRRMYINNEDAEPGDNPGREIVVSDTVGFIQKLPHQLVESFNATLDEALTASVIVHVMDGSSSDAEVHYDAVNKVLGEIDAKEIPQIIVINKADLVLKHMPFLENEKRIVKVSCKNKTGIDELRSCISEIIFSSMKL